MAILITLFFLTPFLLYFAFYISDIYKVNKSGLPGAETQVKASRKVDKGTILIFSVSGIVTFLWVYFVIFRDIRDAGSFGQWVINDVFSVVVFAALLGVIGVVGFVGFMGGGMALDYGNKKMGGWKERKEKTKKEREIKMRDKEVLMKKDKSEIEKRSSGSFEVMRESQRAPAMSGDPFADLHDELYNLMQRNDRNALVARIASIKKTMDTGTFERNINSWVRKYKAGTEAMDAILETERKKGELKRMGLEQKLEQARMEADVEEHITRAERAKVEREKLRESPPKPPEPPRQKSKQEQVEESVNLEIMTFMAKVKKGVSVLEAKRDLERRGFSLDEVEVIVEAADRELSEDKYRHL